jgi:hypothetical protein
VLLHVIKHKQHRELEETHGVLVVELAFEMVVEVVL